MERFRSRREDEVREPRQALPTDTAIKICSVLLKPKGPIGTTKDVHADGSRWVFDRRQDLAFHLDGEKLVCGMGVS